MIAVRDDGGGADSTGSYRVIASHADLLVRGQNVQPAQTVQAEALRHGIVFGFTVPRDGPTGFYGGGVQAAAGLRAGWIDAMAQDQYVLGMSWSQDTNAGGDLIDVMDITVGDPAGEFQTQVTIPLEQLNAVASFQRVADAYAALVAIGAPPL